MAPPESADRRVDVAFGVGVLVVGAVVGGPPERALLGRGDADEREHELRDPSEPVAAVREVPVVPAGDREHPDEVERHREPHSPPGDPGDEGQQRQEVQGDERDRGLAVDVLVGRPGGGIAGARRNRDLDGLPRACVRGLDHYRHSKAPVADHRPNSGLSSAYLPVGREAHRPQPRHLMVRFRYLWRRELRHLMVQFRRAWRGECSRGCRRRERLGVRRACRSGRASRTPGHRRSTRTSSGSGPSPARASTSSIRYRSWPVSPRDAADSPAVNSRGSTPIPTRFERWMRS